MDSDRLQKWALIAEIASAIVIVLTLVLLLFEIRNNTNTLQAQMYQSLTSELNDNRRRFSEPDMALLVEKINLGEFENLKPRERIQLFYLNQAKWALYESAFYSSRRGTLGEAEWSRFELQVCEHLERDSNVWVQNGSMRDSLTPIFVEYVQSNCNWAEIQSEMDTVQ